MSFFLLMNTKEDILKNVSNQTVAGPHRLPYYEGKILWKSMGSIKCPVTNILQIYSFVFNRRKKCIQVWNNL